VLVPECLIRHSYIEEGKGVFISCEEDERVAFFQIDNDEFRNRFNLRDNKVCDLLIFYRHGTARAILMLVELKGNDLSDIEDQIRNPLNAIKNELSRTAQNELPKALKNVKWMALIVTSASSPRSRSDIQKALRGSHVDVMFKYGVRKGEKVDVRPYFG